MRIDPLGESFFILRELSCPAPVAAERLRHLPGVLEAYAAFDTVGLETDGVIDAVRITDELKIPAEIPVGLHHRIPVLYDGEDLEEIAMRVGLSPAQVIELHTRSYECRAVGFCPGFTYLAPLVEPLAQLPRRSEPRPRVAPGSVAIATGMTAIYPLERPGGWWLIGRTPLTLVDEAEEYFPIRAGDSVEFFAIDSAEFERRRGERLPEQ